MTGTGTQAAEKPRRRQARGERRIEQLLEAAAQVFQEVGYPAASTNGIARAAGVSPGTLYQFFPNKEALAVELGRRLMAELEQTHGRVLSGADTTRPLAEILDTVLDPLIAFNLGHPAFFVLIHGPEAPGEIVSDHEELHAVLQQQITDLVARRAPDLPIPELDRVSVMAFAIFRAGLALVMHSDGAQREGYIVELKSALHRYLAPVLGS
ncbi:MULTISPECIES: TetR/AcrR family transcriptional regulator [Kitasatospora]|uniref:AcrR family transcriptional regulator n=2 Tax=Kitasatospora TaxID=2063 RepID=A0ABT1ITG6_9ACTN|nr:TetR/AcrR family transcriptional regulator [Kitasatospora paracochleata]MCP2308264.1 AcrR family transcriptional regulator [Kitasatospora paracochleata]